VADALGIGDKEAFTADVNSNLDSLEGIPGLEQVGRLLKTATVVVTDLAINTQTKTYEFGFGVDLSKSDISFMGVKFNAFGLNIKYVTPPPAP
jgi:hypothetical protein